jgi:hypothetical protein
MLKAEGAVVVAAAVAAVGLVVAMEVDHPLVLALIEDSATLQTAPEDVLTGVSKQPRKSRTVDPMRDWSARERPVQICDKPTQICEITPAFRIHSTSARTNCATVIKRPWG